MKILVLHNNYPAQFKFLLLGLMKLGHDVLFLSLESHGSKLNGIKHYKLKPKVINDKKNFCKPYKGLGKKISNAEVYLSAFSRLKQEGYRPDFVIYHSGWGIAYFLKSVFPNARSAAYAEWWYQWDSAESVFDQDSQFSPANTLNDKVSLSYLNSLQSVELAEADYIWTPTHWQQAQLPLSFQKQSAVIHEGVDTRSFKPRKKTNFSTDELQITYSARALEPMRCFHDFVEIMLRVLPKKPNVRLTVVGKDQPVYRPIAKNHDGFGKMAKKKFDEAGLSERIQWHSRLGTREYIEMLSGSDVHIYFSRPFVASWSLLEAMSSGCSIVSNPSKMTEEFLCPEELDLNAALLTHCFDYEKSSRDVIKYLNSPDDRMINSKNARLIAEKYDFRIKLTELLAFLELK